MKKITFLLVITFLSTALSAQSYPNILNYNFNGTPTSGIKIKTNLPFEHTSHMATVSITGYNFDHAKSIDIKVVWYIWENSFRNYGASSSGGFAPKVFLVNEDGKVVIYLDERSYYVRFTVSAFALGMGENPQWFQGWTAVDEPSGSLNRVQVPYTNSFAGRVGIKTNSPECELDVVGTVRAHEVIINTHKGADFVFDSNYPLCSLKEVEEFIANNKHLPDIAPASEMVEDGVNMGNLQMQMLQKIEELTLYLIEQEKQIKELRQEIIKIKSR